MKTKTRSAGETSVVRTLAYPLLFAGLTLMIGCASDPPPPPQPPPPPPAAAESPPPPTPEVAAAPVAEQAAPPAAAEPECQAADDCKKVREPGAGLQWACENTRCVEQAVPEPPKAEATAEADKGDKASKKKGKGGKKK